MVSETFPRTTKVAAIPTSGGVFPYPCNSANYHALPKTANPIILT
jgi:hypothetical protein